MTKTQTELAEAAKVLARIGNVILEAVAACPMGLPDGHLYAMLQSSVGQAWSLEVHLSMVAKLEAMDCVEKTNHVIRIRPAGAALVAAAKARGGV